MCFSFDIFYVIRSEKQLNVHRTEDNNELKFTSTMCEAPRCHFLHEVG